MKPPTAALGIDLACRRWNDIGSALIAFDRQRFTEAVPGAITWPTSDLTPSAVAGAIDAFARAHDIAAVSIDGPQGWRDPVAPSGRKGVGRACEYATRTPGKTGTRGIAYPSTFLRWIRFSIEVFADLLDRPDVALLNEPSGDVPLRQPGYWLRVLPDIVVAHVWPKRATGASQGAGRWSRSSRGVWWRSTLSRPAR